MDVFAAAAAAPPDQSRIANEIRDDENERSYYTYCTGRFRVHVVIYCTHTHIETCKIDMASAAPTRA
jgi:hypothetical protein